MKIPKPVYTIEFKEPAIKRIKDGQSVSMACKELGLSAENLRLKWENEIKKSGRRYTSRKMLCEVCPSGNPLRDAWIAEQGTRFPLFETCDTLSVSVSGYRAWKRGGNPDASA